MVKNFFSALLLVMISTLAWSQEPSPDLTQLELEELMNIEVTSVSRKEQKLSKTATAVHVITQEDIHCSGATSILEVLRLVPGLQVAQLDANKWAISVRGFNGLFANKLLVLIDGRSVYTPLFAGVYWDVQDTPLEDIERIEVIRGPGAPWRGICPISSSPPLEGGTTLELGVTSPSGRTSALWCRAEAMETMSDKVRKSWWDPRLFAEFQ